MRCVEPPSLPPSVNNSSDVRDASDVGDLHALVRVHRTAFGPRNGLNSGLSGQRAAAAVEAQTSLH